MRRAASVLALLAASTASAQTNREPEHRDMPPGKPASLGASIPAPRFFPRGEFNSVQVNVNADHLNILGDAANEPSIAIDPTAPLRMVIGWRQFDTVSSNFRQAGYAYTNDGGLSWTFPARIQPGLFRSDPVLDCNSNGVFFYYSLMEDFSCQIFTSQDHGHTFPDFVDGFGGDKQWFVIDKSGSASDGNVYATWATCCGLYTDRTFARFFSNLDDPRQPVAQPNSPIHGSMSIGPDGAVCIIGQTGSFIRVNRSLNAQDPNIQPPTFTSTLVNLGGTRGSSGTPNPNPAGILGQMWVDVDRSNGPRRGWIYALSNVDPPGADPQDVFIAHSSDNALTWSAPVRINNDPQASNNWQWMATMSVAPNGRVDVVWIDTRESQSSVLGRLYYASSDDGGSTWQGNSPIGPQWNSTIGWPQQNKIGDYYDMESDLLGANLAYAATYNNEQDVYFLRIGPEDCNGNAIPDADEIAANPALDCNADGILDSCQIAAGTLIDANMDGLPDDCACPADWNHDLIVNSQDFFDYLDAFFNNDPGADFNADSIVNSQDFFDFLNAFFAGC